MNDWLTISKMSTSTTAEILEPEFTKIVENLRGAEGPVFDKNGRFFMVAPEVEENGKHAGQILQIDLTNGKSTIVNSPRDGDCGGIPAGSQCDQDNNIWIADMRLGILKMDPSGSCLQMFKNDTSGRTMQGCNDCIFDYDGNLWITAPAGNIAPEDYRRSTKEEPFGSVYCLTKSKKLILIDTGMAFSNGIAVMHDDKNEPVKLIVAETQTKTLWQYDIKGDGKVGEKSVFGILPGDHQGGPDGMDFDEDNNLLVANWGGGHFEVFPPSGGDPIYRIKCPFVRPSNIHFLPGTSTAYVTEHDFHGLWKFEWKNKGKKQYCDI